MHFLFHMQRGILCTCFRIFCIDFFSFCQKNHIFCMFLRIFFCVCFSYFAPILPLQQGPCQMQQVFLALGMQVLVMPAWSCTPGHPETPPIQAALVTFSVSNVLLLLLPNGGAGDAGSKGAGDQRCLVQTMALLQVPTPPPGVADWFLVGVGQEWLTVGTPKAPENCFEFFFLAKFH